MNETIEKLIASGKEGPWWDFKQTYQKQCSPCSRYPLHGKRPA